MSCAAWSPVLTKGCFSVVFVLGQFPNFGGRRDVTCHAIGVCTPDGEDLADSEDTIGIGFTRLDGREGVAEFCKTMAPRSIDVFNADGSRNADMLEKLQLAAEGRLSHVVN